MGLLWLCLRLIIELILLPLRLLAALAGGVLLAGGALGTPAWLIQTVIGNGGSGRVPAWGMCMLSLAAIPAGLTLLALAASSPRPDPQRVDRVDGADDDPATLRDDAPGLPPVASRVIQPDGIRLAYARLLEHQRRSRRATSAVASGAHVRRHRGAH